MNVHLLDASPRLRMLGRRMELEGETTGPGGLVVGHIVPCQKGVVGGLEEFPRIGIEALGFKLSTYPLDFLALRWWDSSGGWRSWTVVGVPLTRLWTGDQGPEGFGGGAATVVGEGKLEDLFHNSELESLLKLKHFSGLVAMGMSSEDGKVSTIWLDEPWGFLFHILEARTGTVSDFLTGKSQDLHTSWIVGLMVSRWPYPTEDKGVRTTIPGLGESIERHFWANGLERIKGSSYTSSNLVGMATSWGDDLRSANSYALRTCRNLKVPHLQYRLDCPRVVEPIWERIRNQFLV